MTPRLRLIRIGVFDDPTDAALVLAGALSVMLFPPAALAMLERGASPRDAPGSRPRHN